MSDQRHIIPFPNRELAEEAANALKREIHQEDVEILITSNISKGTVELILVKLEVDTTQFGWFVKGFLVSRGIK